MGQKAKVRKAVKEIKEQRKNEENLKKKAGAALATDLDYQEIIDGKKRELITLQRDYRKAYLARVYKGVKVREMNKLVSHALTTNEAEKEKGSDYRIIELRWLGVNYPIDLLKWEYYLELFNYEEAVSSEKYYANHLKEHKGFSEKDLENSRTGKYRKTSPKDEKKKNLKKGTIPGIG